MAEIVRGADTDRFDLAPRSRWIVAISAGLSYNYKNTIWSNWKLEMKIYDALYSWAKFVHGKNIPGIQCYKITMKKSKDKHLSFLVFIYCILGLRCNSQDLSNNIEKEKLTLVSKISLPGVTGRIDHISYDPVNQLAFMAALGNNTVEIVDVNTKRVVRTIPGLHEPQGVVYIPSSKKLVIANGDNGDCIFFDVATYRQLGVVHLKSDADNIRFDSTSQLLYVGYGSGAIAIIDANSMKLVGEIPLDGHPESFQLSKKQNRIYINVPDADEIEVGRPFIE